MIRIAVLILLCCLPAWADKTTYFRRSEFDARRHLVGYYAVEETAALASKEGVYRYLMEDNGKAKEVAFLVEGKPANSPVGYHRIAVEYQPDSRKLTYFGATDQVLARFLFLYGSLQKGGPRNVLIMAQGPDDLKPFPIDPELRVVSESETTKDGQTVKKLYSFDTRDMVSEIRYVDDKGRPSAADLGGWSIRRMVRDEFNNVVDAKYFDVADKPMEYKGVHHSTFKWGAEGVKVEEHHYKLDGSEVKG